MKKNINYFILIFIISLSSCKAQTYNIDNTDVRSDISGAYYKDIDNQLDKYVGVWQYTNGTTTLKIEIQKKIHYLNNSNNFYEDLLFGEYQYIENNVTIVNTLPLLIDLTIKARYHNLTGNGLLEQYQRPICTQCNNTIKRVRMYFTDSSRPYLNTDCYIGYKTDPLDFGETQQIIFDLKAGNSLLPSESSPTEARVPSGTYILTKLP